MLSFSINVIQILLKLVEFVSDPIKKPPNKQPKTEEKEKCFAYQSNSLN